MSDLYLDIYDRLKECVRIDWDKVFTIFSELVIDLEQHGYKENTAIFITTDFLSSELKDYIEIDFIFEKRKRFKYLHGDEDDE